MNLQKREVMWLRDGTTGSGRVTMYKVLGLRPDEEVHIANFGNERRESWRILRRKDGASSGWRGSYASADDALACMTGTGHN